MTTPSPADLRKLADEFADPRNAPKMSTADFELAAECLRERAAEIEREAYRVKQAAIEAREPKPLHVRDDR